MARQLTEEAKKKLMDDTLLFSQICDLLKVRVISLPQLIYRNSTRLTTHDVVLKIAEAMSKTPDEILEEAEETVSASQQ